MPNGYDLSAARRPLTPPDLPGSAVKVVSLPSAQGAGHQYGYQLPAIGNSRASTAQKSPSPPHQQQQQQQQQQQRQQQQQQQQPQPSQDVTQTPRKKWSISPNLQIPSTINTPQEGLPQLAAEVSVFPRKQITANLTSSR
jgi:transcription initiation factor TFIID subunit TAF12